MTAPTPTSSSAGNDPAPWLSVDGDRVADPFAPDSPRSGYTYSPREGYADYPDRYISTRQMEQYR